MKNGFLDSEDWEDDWERDAGNGGTGASAAGAVGGDVTDRELVDGVSIAVSDVCEDPMSRGSI